MSVLSILYVLALILVSTVLLIAAVFGAIVILAYRDRSPGFSYFASGVTVREVTDEANRDL